jgi:hypothetical protein
MGERMTTDAELRERVARLEDRADILECMMRYARGMDRRDRELLRSAYHDGAVDDHVGFVGEVDDFIDWAFAYHATQTRYQHYLLNHTAEIVGDEAHAETYYLFVGTDREPANHMTLSGGRYVDRLERRDGRWAIADPRLRRRVERGVNVVDHRRGDRDDGRIHEGRQARQDGSLL